MLLKTLIFTLGLFLGLMLPYFLTLLVIKYEKSREFKKLIPTAIRENELCNGPHTWIETIAVDRDVEYMPINICEKCGLISGRDLMCTKEGLKRIVQNNKIKEFEESVRKDFEEKENSEIKKLLEEDLKKGLSFDKVNEIYHAGQTSGKRYVIYKIVRSEEKRREIKDSA